MSLSYPQDRPFTIDREKQKSINPRFNDSLSERMERKYNRGAKNIETKIEDYKIISHENDTTYVDTTLTIYKDYKYNYLRKDDFDILPFSNLGQTYNSLSYDLSSNYLMPRFGARARQFNYWEIDDINYYYSPTPFTELMFKTAFEQGSVQRGYQQIDSHSWAY